MSRSPVQARRRLGAVLKDLRSVAGLKIEDAAKELECSASKVSRLENGKGVPRSRDIRDLVKLYGAMAHDEEITELLAESLSEGQGLITDYRDVFEGDMVSDDSARYVAFEQDSSSIWSFEAEVLPGLLQTKDYVTALAEMFFPLHAVDQVRRFVEYRMSRQKILEPDAGVQLQFVVAQQALRRPIGGPGVMREQLDHLAAVLSNGLSHVRFQIAPDTLVSPSVMGGPFSIMQFDDPNDQDVVYLEGRDTATYLESDEKVDRYKATFRTLVSESLSPAASLEIVEAAARDFR